MYFVGTSRAILPLISRNIGTSTRCFASNTLEKYYTDQQRMLDFLEHRKQLVACNIKLNAGGDESHTPVLSKLILLAQDLFSKREPKPLPHPLPVADFEQTGEYKTLDFTCVGALADAHIDPDSNRSSLHLVGPVESVVEIANELILEAVTEFRKRKRGCKLHPEASSQKSLSKVIDIIDHLTFLPMVPGTNGHICSNKTIYSPTWVPTYASWGARQVGNFLKETANIHVFYYQFAQRRNLPLSTVVEKRLMHYRGTKLLPEAVYVGAYKDFIEDYHIILSSECGKRRAFNLAEVLNNTKYGLIDVEATVEQYDKALWEVHCRLLRPHICGSNIREVEFAAHKWRNLQPEKEDQKKGWIVKCYRVGSTYDQCLKLLEDICVSEEKRKEHDASVMQSFQNLCLQHYPTIRTDSEAFL
jgi:hypothetical protein